MTSFDAQSAGTVLLQTRNIGLPQTTSVATDAAFAHFYAVSSPGHEHWHPHLAASELQFNGSCGSHANATCIRQGTDPFNCLAYDDSASFHNDEDEVLDAIKAARQARRKAQNRAAQRKFRERKDSQVKALEAEITDLKEQIEESRSQILDLQDALTEAKTQVETLKSILPSIANYPGTEHRVSRDYSHYQCDKTAFLNTILNSFLQGGVVQGAKDVFISTPTSPDSDDRASYLT